MWGEGRGVDSGSRFCRFRFFLPTSSTEDFLGVFERGDDSGDGEACREGDTVVFFLLSVAISVPIAGIGFTRWCFLDGRRSDFASSSDDAEL